jgi:hypothetical protein
MKKFASITGKGCLAEIIDTPPEVFVSGRVVPGLVGTGLQRCAGVVEAMKPDRSRRSDIRPPAGFTPTRGRALVYRGFECLLDGLKGANGQERRDGIAWKYIPPVVSMAGREAAFGFCIWVRRRQNSLSDLVEINLQK